MNSALVQSQPLYTLVAACPRPLPSMPAWTLASSGRPFSRSSSAAMPCARVFVEEDGVPQRHVLPRVAHGHGYRRSFGRLSAGGCLRAVDGRTRPAPAFACCSRLFDSTLLRLGDQHYVWRLALHRLIADSRSLALVYRYTAEAYAAAAAGSIDALRSRCRRLKTMLATIVGRPATPAVRWKPRTSLRPHGRLRQPLPVPGERYVLDLGAERTALLRRMAADCSLPARPA